MAAYAELDRLKQRLDDLRPIDAEKLEAIREKFRLDWTYHSNALEGNPLTLSETSFFIREGLTSKGKPLSAYLEAQNHMEALGFLDSVIAEREPITENLVRLYHSMLFKKIDTISVGSGPDRRSAPIQGGQYKQQNNHVVRLDGKILQFTDMSQVAAEMEQLVKWCSENKGELHPLELASQFHHRLVRIHPFLDGNGRVSRLLLNTILMQAGYTPAIIPVEEKKEYLEALQAADDGGYALLYGFIEGQVSKTLGLTIDVIEGREAFDFDDLARMLKNMALKASEIREDLGPAIQSPEIRAAATAARLAQDLTGLLQRHVTNVALQGLNMNLGTNVAPFMTNAVAQLRNRLNGITLPAGQVNVSGTDRAIPKLQVTFFVQPGKQQVAIAVATLISKFNAQNLEEVRPESANLTSVLGSIVYEDWDKKTVQDFAVEVLKNAYSEWETEMERRKALIAAEEAELEQYRRR
jgi:Fic family protein